MLALGVASLLDLDSCGGGRLELWSRARLGDWYSAVQARGPLQLSTPFYEWYGKQQTFFCSLTTLVHFFSSKPSYFFRVPSSKLADMLASSRKASAVFDAPITPRYATMALFLPASGQYLPAGWICSRTHSSSACRSVNIALMAARLGAQAGSPLAATIHFGGGPATRLIIKGVLVLLRSLGEGEVR